MLVILQARHDQAADRENDRGDQIQAHQVGYQDMLLGGKARHDADLRFHDRFCKNGHQSGHPRGGQEEQVGDAREDIPQRPPVFLVPVEGGVGDGGEFVHGSRSVLVEEGQPGTRLEHESGGARAAVAH